MIIDHVDNSRSCICVSVLVFFMCCESGQPRKLSLFCVSKML